MNVTVREASEMLNMSMTAIATKIWRYQIKHTGIRKVKKKRGRPERLFPFEELKRNRRNPNTTQEPIPEVIPEPIPDLGIIIRKNNISDRVDPKNIIPFDVLISDDFQPVTFKSNEERIAFFQSSQGESHNHRNNIKNSYKKRKEKLYARMKALGFERKGNEPIYNNDSIN